ncbi:unnamed protein product [Kluyveromyces dobzhanskii CBS 2104]|uniref:WGS project CCBQ000000000 data, contig 00041 n=1 Tax=Kluyveromyces dobzhanskii CBS 2104 TaxID=1427455 RepID=A0A0A8L057_9SACH|nr:unnamed protein product [Kluyveromyces dobzhanskii CBS 2104]
MSSMLNTGNKNVEEVMNSLINVSSTGDCISRITPNNPLKSPVAGSVAVSSRDEAAPCSNVGKALPVTPSEEEDVDEVSIQSPSTSAGASADAGATVAATALQSQMSTENADSCFHSHGNGCCAKTELSRYPLPSVLDSPVLKTIFVGKFRNVLDDPDILLNKAFSYLHAKSLFPETLSVQWHAATYDEFTFDHWCKNSPLPLALLSVNFLEITDDDSERKKQFLHVWQTCWQQCMKNSYDESFLPLSILIYVHIHSEEKLSHSMLTTSVMYQQILFAMIKTDSTNPLAAQVYEPWAIFDIFVSLLLKSEEFTEVSTLIYQWFLTQKLWQDYTLSEFVDRILQVDADHNNVPMSTLLVVQQALFCETIMFKGFETHYKTKDSLHNAVILVNRLASKFLRRSKNAVAQSNKFNTWKIQVFILHAPPKFVDMINSYCVNPSITQYWQLYIATWFEFIQDVVPSTKESDNNSWAKFHLSNKWFHNKVNLNSGNILQELKSIPLVEKNINNNLAICCLPIISSLQHKWHVVDQSVKKLVFSTLLFQVKLFATTLLLTEDDLKETVTRSMKVFSNPIVHLLLFVWYCSIYHRSDGMPKLLYRRGSETDFDNYTMENHFASQFIKRYIVLSRKCVDTDALIENDFKKLLFRDEVEKADDFIYFKGFHFLLSRILDSIIRHLQQIISPSDPEFECTTKLIQELNATISQIQNKINNSPQGKNYLQPAPAKPVSPMSTSSPSSVTNTPHEEPRRANSVSLGMMHVAGGDLQSRDRFFNHAANSIKLPPLKLDSGNDSHNNEFATTNNTSSYTNGETSEIAGSSHIFLPPPMLQTPFINRDRGRFTLPPPSTFFPMK